MSDAANLELLTAGLGQEFVTADVSLKPYACCGSTHSSIDAVRWLVQQHAIRPQDVEEIVVYNHSVVKLQTSWRYEPISPMQAQMNIEYCVAVALVEGQAGPQQFSSDRIADLGSWLTWHIKCASRSTRKLNRFIPAPFQAKWLYVCVMAAQYSTPYLGQRARPNVL